MGDAAVEQEIDKISIDKIDIDNDSHNIQIDMDFDINKSHNGKAITKIVISPNKKYLVTYSEDDKSIVGWNEYEDSLRPVKLRLRETPHQICVSDDKKLLIINEFGKIRICDMMNKGQKIVLDCHHPKYNYKYYSTFKKDELILCVDHYNIFIYSTKTINNKWKCKRMYRIPIDLELINISKYDKLYLFSNNSIYKHDLITEKSIKIYDSDEKIDDYKDIEIFSNKKFICIRIKNKIIIYSNELEIPVVSLDIYKDIQLHNFMHHADLIPLLLPLLSNSNIWNPIMEQYWKEYLNRVKEEDQLSKEYLTKSFPDNIQTTTEYAFGILDGNFWKVKLEILLKMVISYENSDDKEMYKTYNNLNNPYMGTIPELIQEVINHKPYVQELTRNLIKWKINWDIEDSLELQVFINNHINKPDEKWVKVCVQRENLNAHLLGVKLFNDNEIIILTTQGLLIYHLNENCKSISLNYYYYIKINLHDNEKLLDCKNVFSKPTLPLPNYGSFKFYDKWISSIVKSKENFSKYGSELLTFGIKERNVKLINEIYNENIKNIEEKFSKYGGELLAFGIEEHNEELIKNIYKEYIKNIKENNTKLTKNINKKFIKYNKEILLKYGVELLISGIKEHNIELIENIYKECMNYFKEDFGNNWMILSIITSTMPLLNKHYPEYISKYSSETIIILNSSFYNIEYKNSNLHLYSFQYPSIINLTRSIWWLKYTKFMLELENNYEGIYYMLNNFQTLIVLSILPIYFTIFYILSKHYFIYNFEVFSIYYRITNIFNRIFSKLFINTTTLTITFMNPYIKFVNYPQNYNWFKELIIPQSSPFVKTISKEIYKTWNGETLINFKWNNYGKYYYTIIWIGFIVLLGCFTTAATISQQYINDNIRKQLLIASIILGFIHLSFEIRQFIYNPIKWIHNFWNIFDLMSYLLPIYTSIYWLQTNNRNIQLLSFSCLFLDIKFLLFFRVFESFGIYFAIIISVGKQIASFLIVLFIIIISFAHTFYILLSPESNFSFKEYTSNNDSNNPWNIASTYYQIFENGTVNSNSYIIQSPNENTNMFIDFGTAIFAMYKFLTGDSSILSNWTYKNNPSLIILIVLFSFMIVVYLMNLFIGLLNNAIEKDNNRVSYLIQKAEILAEIELFYLLPHQRRWNAWFPEVIYYYADFNKTRQKIKEMINEGELKINEFPELNQKLLDKFKI